jgi:hypothetical protein
MGPSSTIDRELCDWRDRRGGACFIGAEEISPSFLGECSVTWFLFSNAEQFIQDAKRKAAEEARDPRRLKVSLERRRLAGEPLRTPCNRKKGGPNSSYCVRLHRHPSYAPWLMCLQVHLASPLEDEGDEAEIAVSGKH